jgi:hypothetical protein
MATSTERDLCHLCAVSSATGQFLLGAETRRENGQWVFVKNLHDYSLCDACYWLVAGVAQRAASSMPGATELPLGVPRSESTVKRAGYCDYCDGELGDESVGVELVTDRRQVVGRVSRHVGTMLWQRICHGCARWWSAALRDAASITGRSHRSLEGAPGGWIGRQPADVLPVSLSKRDRETLETTLRSMGTRVLDSGSLAESERPTFFVRAGRRDRARTFVAASRPRARRCVVVAALDSLEDARQALLEGAADLLAEPLTPNQIAGALDRLGTGWANARDSRTGIPLLGDGIPQTFYGLPATDLTFGAAAEPPLFMYLSLRRMLRGFDFVGLHGGAVTARVYASSENVPGIAERLRDILGVEPNTGPINARVGERAA